VPQGGARPGADGFKSPESKRSFVRRAVVAGLVCAAIFIGGLVLWISTLFLSVGGTRNQSAGAYAVASWNKSIWYLSRDRTAKEGGSYRLMEKAPDAPAVLRDNFTFGHDAFLFAGPEDPGRLWVLSQDRCAYWDGQSLHWIDAPGNLDDPGRPFFLGHLPAMATYTDGLAEIWVLDSGHWLKRRSLLLLAPPKTLPESSDCNCKNLKVTWRNGKFEWFYKDGAVIRQFEGIPKGPDLDISAWDSMIRDSAPENWAPVNLPGGLMLVDTEKTAHGNMVRVWSKDKGQWTQIAALADKSKSHAVLGDGPQSYSLVLADSGLALVSHFGALAGPADVLIKPASSPLWLILSLFVLWPVILSCPLLLTGVLQHSIKEYRISEGTLRGTKVLYASLWRRLFARIVDTGLVFLIVVMTMLATLIPYFIWHRSKMQGPQALLLVLAIYGLLLLSSSAAYVALIAMEGHSGYTPGRKLFNIRLVGMNLKPCGFGRAMLRALLTMVDGFCMGTVGLYIIAFSRRYQRLGDTVADTVVIRAHD